LSNRIHLNEIHKVKRVNSIKSWICSNHNWEIIIFSDEKKFSLDGPHDWRSYIHKSSKDYYMKRQGGGGGIMVWIMAMPNGLLSFNLITDNLNSDKYVEHLSKNVVPIIKLNYAAAHKSRKVQDFFTNSRISVLEWPSRSPDLTIVENCWKTISDLVYDGKKFQSKEDLVEKITIVINQLNQSKRSKVLDLYKTIRSRLCTVLEKHWDLYNR